MFLGTCNVYNGGRHGLGYFRTRELAWYKKNGYRLCKEGEAACFNTLIVMSHDRNWVTFIEDSVEGLSAMGMVLQAHVRAIDGMKCPSLLFNYVDIDDHDAMMLACSNANIDDVKVHVHDNDNFHIKGLGYTQDSTLAPTAKEFSAFSDCTDEELKAVWDMPLASEKHRIMRIAELVGLDPMLSCMGFSDFFGQGIGTLDDLDYEFCGISLCVDDKKLKEPLIMPEGLPAFELLGSSVTILPDGYNISLTVINRGGGHNTGFSVFMSAQEIASPFDVDGCSMDTVDLSLNFDRNGTYTEAPNKYTQHSEYTFINGIGKSYICEFAGISTPVGVVIPAGIKRRLSKQNKLHELETRAAINLVTHIKTQGARISKLLIGIVPHANTFNGGCVYTM